MTGVEMFRKLLDQGMAGDNIGALITDASARTWSAGGGDGQAGHHPHTKFKAQIYVLSKEEGGRHTPFFKGYRPSSTSAPPT